HVRDFTGEEKWKFPAAFSPDGKFAVSDVENGPGLKNDLFLWEVESGQEVRTFEKREGGDSGSMFRNGATFATAFTPDGTTVVSVDSDYFIRRWEVGTGQLITKMSLMGEYPTAEALTEDGRLAVTVAGWDVNRSPGIRIKLWDTVEEKLLRTV